MKIWNIWHVPLSQKQERGEKKRVGWQEGCVTVLVLSRWLRVNSCAQASWGLHWVSPKEDPSVDSTLVPRMTRIEGNESVPPCVPRGEREKGRGRGNKKILFQRLQWCGTGAGLVVGLVKLQKNQPQCSGTVGICVFALQLSPPVPLLLFARPLRRSPT